MTSAVTTTARPSSSSSTSKGRPSPTCCNGAASSRFAWPSWLASVADAIHHAHGAGLVHRDLKPSNIMIDEQGQPRVADFGLAITEAVQHDKAGEVAGTPTHMAPEQVRGEVHRLDGRTDVWALGIILYQGLTGRLPFAGRDRATLFDEILRREPRPPRQIDDAIPRELERICLKCLSKRMTDRYGSALDLAEDLRAWLDAARSPAAAASRTANGRRLDAEVATRIVPRGLRAFGREDADFFLDLLPGPRDRDGLPESIRFWKTRIEERDADATFRVGLLYGPSGCGKSSLVKAGLLPRLAEGVVAVYVEATPDQTGPRSCGTCGSGCRGSPGDLGLVETFASLRRGDGDGPKVVVVLDQFEQWLHAHGGEPESELVDALRQCDGGRVQAVVLVRDDFGMAAARFMDATGRPDRGGAQLRHGRPVRRRPRPAGPGAIRPGLRQAARGTARPVRRAGAVPGRWSPPAWRGTARSSRSGWPCSPRWSRASPGSRPRWRRRGAPRASASRFLEETFSSRSANPGHRIHERAARNVLKALLPGVGTDIKGQTRSYAELREASGLSENPGAFADLLRVLDGELRLITPIDHSESRPDPGDDPSSKWWQLTHDYLVPTLKAWLTRKQKETRRGRAELRLEDRATLWSARPERRHLPSLPEWIGIRVLTDATRWSAPQRAMMRRAGRLHGCRLAAACLLVAAFLAGAMVMHEHNERKEEARESQRAGRSAARRRHCRTPRARRVARARAIAGRPATGGRGQRSRSSSREALPGDLCACRSPRRRRVATDRVRSFVRSPRARRDPQPSGPARPGAEGPALGRGGSRVVDPGLAAPHRDAARSRRRRQRSVARLRESRHE